MGLRTLEICLSDTVSWAGSSDLLVTAFPELYSLLYLRSVDPISVPISVPWVLTVLDGAGFQGIKGCQANFLQFVCLHIFIVVIDDREASYCLEQSHRPLRYPQEIL